jgi:hypothetical protein
VSIARDLICRDCGTSFVFTTGEQNFYASKGFSNEPGRCPACRTSRGRAPTYSGSYAVVESEREERQLFAAVCSQCGTDTQASAQLVLGDAPIFCPDCRATPRGEAYAATGGWRESW